MKNLFKKLLKYLLPIALGSVILFRVYRDFDFTKVGDVLLSGMNWGWMLLSLLFGALSMVIRGRRWRQTLEPLGVFPETKNCVNTVFVSYAADLVIPRLGEVTRCGLLSKYANVPFGKSFGTVVTERLVDTLCLAFITTITLLLQMKMFNRFFAETGVDIFSIANRLTSVHFYFILLCVIATGVLLYYLIRTLAFFTKVKGIALNVREGLVSLRKVRNFPLFILFTILIWFCNFMHFYITFRCFTFTEQLGIGAGLVMFVAGSFTVIVPTPAGAGPWHFAMITAMSLYGVSVSEAGIFALLVHGIQAFLVVLLGIFGLAALPFTNKNKIR